MVAREARGAREAQWRSYRVAPYPAVAKTRAAFSIAASRMNADFVVPETRAARSMSSAPDSGHLKDMLAM